MPELNEESLQAVKLEVLALQMTYDEKLITGLRHLVLGQVDEAKRILFELADIEKDLTYIKSYLQDSYKLVVSLH